VTGNWSCCRYDPVAQRLTLSLHVQPGAKKSAFVGVYGEALKIKIAAPAVDNKANAALVEFLSETLQVPKSAIVIRRGATARRKLVEIVAGPDTARAIERVLTET
jgi:uncharacterized protein (TIGR00251 family)